jgi:DNA-binding response OmpR family regulator
VVRLLEAKGYEVLGSCTPDEFREAVRKAIPDLVILEAGQQGHDEIVRTIRLEKDLQHVYVVQMVSKDGDGAR